MYLTELEIEILEHRLKQPMLVFQTLSGEIRNLRSQSVSKGSIKKTCKQLLLTIREIQRLPDSVSLLAGDVLRDCVDNSQILYAVMRVAPQRQGLLHRAGRTLARKIEELTGKHCEFPTEILDWRCTDRVRDVNARALSQHKRFV
jgi:hypothetical protein